jgi:hypothetical protein
MLAPDRQTAIDHWYGYDAPATPLAASSSTNAIAAAQPLRDNEYGKRVTHEGPGPSEITDIGHSFGTLPVALAAKDSWVPDGEALDNALATALAKTLLDGEPLAADRLVLLASPGVGVDNVTKLRLRGVDPADMGTRVYAATLPYDPITATPRMIHGRKPVDRRFGAQILTPSGAKAPWQAPRQSPGDLHRSYFWSGHMLLSIAEVVVGQR